MTLTTAAPAPQSIPAAAHRAVILVEDHPVTRLGLKAIIEQQPDLQVVAEADNAPQAVQLITRHRPDVAVIKSGTGLLQHAIEWARGASLG